MYQTMNLSPSVISKLKIRNQDKIEDLTGSKLDPLKAFEVIKRESNDFSEENDKAKEADALFAELLKQNGIDLQSPEESKEEGVAGDTTKVTKEILRQETERARALDLLELELELELAA